MQLFESAFQAVEWVNGVRWKGEKKGLLNTRALLDALGNPETRMGRIVHVAGTNGKGSTCAMIERALRECSYKTGLFTSPYLCFFNERIRLNGRPIPDEKLISIASRVREVSVSLTEQGIFPTTFEILTAMACLYFAEEQTDFAVMEVGMGGRFDSTNVLSPDVCAIAAIGLDHMARLGNTIEEIASEKAGIIKPGVPAVVYSGQPESVLDVFRAAARQAQAPLFETAPARLIQEDARGCEFAVGLPATGLKTLSISLSGKHQIHNAALALTVLDRLNIDMETAISGLSKTRWPGRLEWLGRVLIDGAHNPQGALALSEYLKTYFSQKRIVLLTGMMQDKQIDACAKIFSQFADEVVTTQVSWPRAEGAFALAGRYKNARAVKDVKDALLQAQSLAGNDGIVVCAGSIYLAGDVRTLLLPDDDGSL